jgi:long-chain acyl-CoA synthetase
LHNVLANPNKPLFFTPDDTGNYVGNCAMDIQRHVMQLGHALRTMGIAAGNRVGIFARNQTRWVIADLAIMSIGAISVPIYPTSNPEDIAHITQDANISVLFVDDASLRDCIPDHITQLFLNNNHPYPKTDHYLSWNQLLESGKTADTNSGALAKQLGTLSPDQTATIVYTSGTTGQSKGVVLTHANILSNVRDVLSVIPLNENEIALSFLPLSHIFERTVGYYTLLAVSGRTYYIHDIETLAESILEINPTIMLSVPRLYEKVHLRIHTSASRIQRILLKSALKISQRYHAKKLKSDYLLQLAFSVADRLVLKKIRQRFGKRIRFFVSGGAGLNPKIAQFFHNCGLLIIEGYGLTEASPIIACNRLDAFKFGTVGQSLPSVTVTVQGGELLAKGPNIMVGYHNNPTETDRILSPEGWLSTGDLVSVDTDGFISIIDRKKDLIILSTGKNVPPIPIESKLKENRWIQEAVLIGDNRNYIAAVIFPDQAQLSQHPTLGNRINTPDWNTHPELLQFYQKVIRKQCRSFTPFKQPKQFILVTESVEQFSTPTLKIKRRLIQDFYCHQLDELYKTAIES